MVVYSFLLCVTNCRKASCEWLLYQHVCKWRWTQATPTLLKLYLLPQFPKHLLKSFLLPLPGEENSSRILWFTTAAHLLDTGALGLCVWRQHWPLCQNQKRIQTGQTGISRNVGVLFSQSRYSNGKEEKLDRPAEPGETLVQNFFTYNYSRATGLECICTGWSVLQSWVFN